MNFFLVFLKQIKFIERSNNGGKAAENISHPTSDAIRLSHLMIDSHKEANEDKAMDKNRHQYFGLMGNINYKI
jgi:hypothetical protein